MAAKSDGRDDGSARATERPGEAKEQGHVVRT